MPESRAEQVERRALAGEDRAQGAAHARDRRGLGEHLAVVDEALELDVGVERAEDGLGGVEPATTPGARVTRSRRARRRLVDGRVGRDVAAADVLGERRPDDALERRCRRSLPCLELRRGAAPQDDVPLEGLALGREVDAEVGAAALLARERALGDEPCEQVRRRAQALEPGGVADEPAVAPERAAELGGDRRLGRARVVRPSSTSRRPGSSSAASAARRPKTRHSSSEFDASRFAPCTPVAAHSPAA